MYSTQLKKFFIILALASSPLVALAEDAPVYDVDNYPPQFDGQPVTSNTTSPSTVSDESPAPARLSAEQRLARVEQQMKNISHSDSAAKMDAAQAEIQSLRGQVEQLEHQLQQAQNQQRLMYTELDKRLAQTNTPKKEVPAVTDDDAAPAPTPKKSSAPAAAETQKVVHSASTKKASPEPAVTPVKTAATNDQPNVAEEQQIYQTAYDLIKAKKYNEAVNTLQKMLQKYPTGQFAANAHYWLGELYGLLNKNDQSAEEFSNVVKNYPDSPKIADAQLKLGLIYAAEFKWPEAKAAFKKVVSSYPGTASARLASEQLKQLKQSQAQAKVVADRQ